jgi:hypothetical protein
MLRLFSRLSAKVTRITAPHGAVPRATNTLMDRRGWRKNWSGGWTGPYAIGAGTWPGRIEPAGDTFRVYIQDPPPAIRKHHKWACFHRHDDGGWYRIHLQTSPVDRDPNAVVRYVEQILTESLGAR